VFIDAVHMQKLARLMREKVNFVPVNDSMLAVLEYARHSASWPNPGSVGSVDGAAVVAVVVVPPPQALKTSIATNTVARMKNKLFFTCYPPVLI
jgi:hypothetical protein